MNQQTASEAIHSPRNEECTSSVFTHHELSSSSPQHSPSPAANSNSSSATSYSPYHHHVQDQEEPSSNLSDDVFGINNSTDPTTGLKTDSYFSLSDVSDSTRLHIIHSKAGYRDAVSVAREAAVQGGFDEGYLLGSVVGARVGLLMGVVEGVETAIVGNDESEGDGDGNARELRTRVERLARRMERDLRIENVLGPDYMLEDGSWGWEVDDAEVERMGVEAVAEAHPLVERYAGIVGEWVEVLGLRRLQDPFADLNDG